MSKIEDGMVRAVRDNRAWAGGNTMVLVDGSVYLHGHRIAYWDPNGDFVMDLDTFHKFPTVTTKSRLRALGLDYPSVKTLRGLPYAT